MEVVSFRVQAGEASKKQDQDQRVQGPALAQQHRLFVVIVESLGQVVPRLRLDMNIWMLALVQVLVESGL